MAALEPGAIVLDTNVAEGDEPVVRLRFETTESSLNAIPSRHGETLALIGKPTREGLKLMVRSIGYRIKYIEWDAEALAEESGINAYLVGRRITAVLMPRRR